MEVDETENSGSADPKNDSDKTKGKRKLYVGSQALGYRRDHMEVSFLILSFSPWSTNPIFFYKTLIIYCCSIRCCPP